MFSLWEWFVDFFLLLWEGMKEAWINVLTFKFIDTVSSPVDEFGTLLDNAADRLAESEQDYMTTSFSYYRPIEDFQREPNRPNPAMICQYKDCNNRPMSGAFYCYEHRYGVAEGTVPGLLEAITTGFTVTKRCKHCRQLNGDEQLYCEHCGAEL